MAALQLKPLLATVTKEKFDDASDNRLTYCGIVVILITMFLAGYMGWFVNEGCPMYQRVVNTLVAFTNGWLYILYVVVGVMLGSIDIGCSKVPVDLDVMFKL